jgi:predicted RNase H-like HicB family nuclease
VEEGADHEGKTEMNQIHYSMIIQWDSRDNIFVVRVPELPGCVTHGTTYEEAVKQGKDAIESWIMAAIADNEPLPPPRDYVAA